MNKFVSNYKNEMTKCICFYHIFFTSKLPIYEYGPIDILIHYMSTLTGRLQYDWKTVNITNL